MHGAVALWVRADWRRRTRAIVALALLVGVAGAIVLTAVAGARRTATSFERLTAESRSADVVVDVGEVDPEIVEEITRLPLVEESGAFTVVFAVVEGVETDLGIFLPRDDRVGTQIERDRILRGRRPDPARLDEVAVDETVANVAGIDVDDEVSIATLSPEQVRDEDYFPPRGPRLQVTVVGVVRGPDDLVAQTDGRFLASPALLDTVRGEVDEYTIYMAVELTDDATVADFEAAIGDLIPPDQEYETLPFDVRSTAPRGTISAVAAGLAVFAIVAAAATLVAVGQAVGRHVASARHDEETLLQLGVSRTDRRVALVLSTLPAALGGAAVAVVGAWLASPVMPIGLARRADPDLGFSADWTVLGFGGVAIAAVVLVSAMITATWMTRVRRAARTPAGPSAIAAGVSRAGAGPVAANGVRLALDRRPPTLPVRSAIAGVVAAIVGTVAVVTFAASVDRLLAAPAQWGYEWDLLLNFTSADVDSATERIVDDARLAAVARWDAGFSFVEGEGVRAFGLTPIEGEVGFSLRSGRQPASPTEVVLGSGTAERLGVEPGERVEVAPQPGVIDPASVLVVGTALFPDDTEGSFDDAVGYFGPAFADLAFAPDLFEASQLVVRMAPGVDLADLAASMDEEFPDSVSGESLPSRPSEVANLSGVRSLPRWLAAFVAVLGIASLGHVLLTTLWRRRRELATLRSLGLTPRQTSLCLVWQAVTIAVVGLVIGVPLGLVAGDAAWSAVAGPIGVATDADRPLAVVGATALGALAVAAVLAVLPAWRAARLRPAEALRAE